MLKKSGRNFPIRLPTISGQNNIIAKYTQKKKWSSSLLNLRRVLVPYHNEKEVKEIQRIREEDVRNSESDEDPGIHNNEKNLIFQMKIFLLYKYVVYLYL